MACKQCEQAIKKLTDEVAALRRELAGRPEHHVHHHYPVAAPTYVPQFIPRPQLPYPWYEVTCGGSAGAAVGIYTIS